MSSFVALSSRRKARGLSQSDVARAAGVSRQAIGAIEAGRVQPSVAVALAIARTLACSVEELFGDPSGPRLEAEVPAGAAPRAAVAIVEGRIVARSLGSDPAQLEAAGALVSGEPTGRLELEALADSGRLASTVFLSGCEPAVGLLARHLDLRAAHGVWFPTTNRDALADFLAGRVHVAALHGSEAEIDRSLRRVRALEPDLFELATIEEGWIVAGGNPLKLRGARDLARTEVRLANRAPGSAARALLESELRRSKVAGEGVNGYKRTLGTHADVARAVAVGYADIGIGVAGVATAFKLGFIPLRAERCILAVRRSDRSHLGVAALVAALRSSAFRRDLGAFGPYDTARLGEQL